MSPQDRATLDNEIAKAVVAARAELAVLRQTETPKQQLPRQKRQRRLDRRNNLLWLRDGIGAKWRRIMARLRGK